MLVPHLTGEMGMKKIKTHFFKVTNYFKTHKKSKYALISFFIIAVLLYGCYLCQPYIRYITRDVVTTSSLDKLKLDSTYNLMIVAHPDDEILWGGKALIEDDYLVVCITNGWNKTRKAEFFEVMNATNNIGLILDYPDKIFGQRSDWSFCKNSISKDLNTIISYKKWNKVVTHNQKGEYGHIHHIMTHNLVKKACDNTNFQGQQYYFGKYYKKVTLEAMTEDELPSSISEEIINKKTELAKKYVSQKGTIKSLAHMIPYENFTLREE